MGHSKAIWSSPAAYLKMNTPDHPVCFFAPSVLNRTAKALQARFDGLVTYAVKANPDPVILENLITAGVTGFDVASPTEIKTLRRLSPSVRLHYNNPVRSRPEITFAQQNGVLSYAVDAPGELQKLADMLTPEDVEVSVRFCLPVTGAHYDFGSKFGADPKTAVELLRRAAQLGFTPSLTFHPGTQCHDPQAWRTYITEATAISKSAGTPIRRLNIGGGLPSHRRGKAPDLEQIFDTITQAVKTGFGASAPALLCEPGRAMVAESCTLVTRVKAIRPDGSVFLNDGIYGGLSEWPVIETSDRIFAISPSGAPITGAVEPRQVLGPTCDSLDVLPGALVLPKCLQENDYVMFKGLGAYSSACTTGFNGYGQIETVTVLGL